MRKHVIAGCLAISLIATVFMQSAIISPSAQANEEAVTFNKGNEYSEYIEEFQNAARPSETIEIIPSQNYKFDGISCVVNDGEKIIWKNPAGGVSWEFNVQNEGLYCFFLSYNFLSDDTRFAEFQMKLDEKLPFRTASSLVFPRYYEYDEIKQDNKGNDIRPTPACSDVTMNEFAIDREGMLNEPYSFYLSAGTHTLTLNSTYADIVIEKLGFCNTAQKISYAEYKNQIEIDETGDFTETVQGERPLYVNDKILYPVYDKTSVSTQYSDPAKLRLNTIGGPNFSSQGQRIVWKVNVPKAGYYKIGIRTRQNMSIGLTSYRKLTINGELPFKEAATVAFPFGRKWQTTVIGSGEEEWLFCLKEGDNTIALETVAGEVAGISAALQELVKELNSLYRRIIMITGVNPDSLRDYQLEKEIPDLNESVIKLRDDCNSCISQAKALGNQATGDLSKLNELVVVLDTFIKNPEIIAVKVSRLQEYYTLISTLIMNLKNQPLEIDYLMIASADKTIEFPQTGFLENIIFSLKQFFSSFVEEYSVAGDDVSAEKSINVWINMGREQTAILKSLSNSIFTPKTGIGVNVSLVQQSLVQASLSGSGPDVVLFVAQAEPINLAMRNALEPLDGYDTYNEVAKRFQKDAITPYKYNGKTYALPLQENFPMMFYRTDILSELGIALPKTWDDFYNVIKVLQQNNMTAGLPNMPSDSQMTTNNGIFATFMYQQGGKYYNDDLSQTNFLSREAVGAFKTWTGMYSSYGLPYQYDFFNRFRTGEMPIGLEIYTMYNKLLTGAPEINGLWKMAPIPGTMTENGTINNSVCGSGTSILMMKRCQDKPSAWEFIDWFTSAEAQASFGLELETLLGAAGRYDTANREAFGKLPWTAEEQKIINTQWDNMFQLPQVPGGYYVDRNLTNAFRKVVFYGNNPRDTLAKYNMDINSEISRKRKEFGLDYRN